MFSSLALCRSTVRHVNGNHVSFQRVNRLSRGYCSNPAIPQKMTSKAQEVLSHNSTQEVANPMDQKEIRPLITSDLSRIPVPWKLNTSNPNKLAEFRAFFALYGAELVSSDIDLDEIDDSDSLKVINQKASVLEELTLVEDTILEVENADIGSNVRWRLDQLDNCIGNKATWTTFLAYRQEDKIKIYRGCVNGTIVAPQGDQGFGFDKYFLPEGSTSTLAQAKPDRSNARKHAVDALLNNQLWQTVSPIYDWQGQWQQKN